jgi:hypothetical protein
VATATVVAAGASPVSAVPHSAQNFCPGTRAVPHTGQLAERGVPHSTQKRAFSALAVEHEGQITAGPNGLG